MDVLLVDDSKTMRMVVQRTLRQAGFRSLVIGEADSGRTALEVLTQHTPKLILSDWNMPEMSGIEFLQELQKKMVPIPFGFITSEGSEEIRFLAAEHGARFVITKPFTPERFESVLSQYLG